MNTYYGFIIIWNTLYSLYKEIQVIKGKKTTKYFGLQYFKFVAIVNKIIKAICNSFSRRLNLEYDFSLTSVGS